MSVPSREERTEGLFRDAADAIEQEFEKQAPYDGEQGLEPSAGDSIGQFMRKAAASGSL